jgi:hypothetical protein
MRVPGFVRFTLPRGAIRRHMEVTHPHRERTAAPPPVALPGNPTDGIPVWNLEAGREGLQDIYDRASGRR